MIVENDGALNVDSHLADHVHDMKSLNGGNGKAKSSFPKVKSFLDISSGELAADPKTKRYKYTYNGLKGSAKPLSEVVCLKLSAGAKVTLIEVDNGKKILDQHAGDFWIVNQMTKKFFCEHLHGQKKIRHFEGMYDLLDSNNPVRYIPEADRNFYGDCDSNEQKEQLEASGPIKCPVALFEPTNF